MSEIWFGYTPNNKLSKTQSAEELLPHLLVQLEKAEKAIMRFAWERYNYSRRLHQSYRKNALLRKKDFMMETDCIFPKKSAKEFQFILSLPAFVKPEPKPKKIKIKPEPKPLATEFKDFKFEDEKNIDWRYD